MNDLLTPFEIEILLYYYSIPEPFPNKESQAFRDAVKKFRKAGILKSITDNNDLIFEEGVLDVYVNAIRRIQLPVKSWTVPQLVL